MDENTTTIPLYFTRWITHFCAPVFVFLSGVSAYLSAKNKSRSEASWFLLKRGAWLVLAEITFVSLGLTYNPLFNFIILQVIWAIGWSMIILGLLVRFSYKAVLVAGLLLFFGHNISNYITAPQGGIAGLLWNMLLATPGTVVPLSDNHFVGVFYTILPWAGVMLMGYSAGYWFRKEVTVAERRKKLLITGISLIGLFIFLRTTNLYGNPADWDGKSLLTFLNTSKYPPSLLYLCMTLGPALIILALVETVKGKWVDIISTYGKVPFFYYLLHFYLIHALVAISFFATHHTAAQIVDPNSPFLFRPVQFGFSLWIVYAIWIGVVVLLYFPCRWYSKYKATHQQWWLKYV